MSELDRVRSMLEMAEKDLKALKGMAVALRYEAEEITADPLNRPQAVKRVQALFDRVKGAVEGEEA